MIHLPCVFVGTECIKSTRYAVFRTVIDCMVATIRFVDLARWNKVQPGGLFGLRAKNRARLVRCARRGRPRFLPEGTFEIFACSVDVRPWIDMISAKK